MTGPVVSRAILTGAFARMAAAAPVAACALLCGCSASPIALQQRPPARLQVVHVVSESYLLAGFPFRQCEVATTTRLQPFMIAVVDGYPMFGRDGPLTKDAAAKLQSYWTTVWGRGLETAADRTAAANRIDPDLAVAVGDRVLIGGFALPARRLSPIEFLDLPPAAVPGVVAETPQPGDAHFGVILVPPGNYAGFVGGPVASACPSDGVRVWGAVVAGPLSHPRVPATWLIVQRLH